MVITHSTYIENIKTFILRIKSKSKRLWRQKQLKSVTLLRFAAQGLSVVFVQKYSKGVFQDFCFPIFTKIIHIFPKCFD